MFRKLTYHEEVLQRILCKLIGYLLLCITVSHSQPFHCIFVDHLKKRKLTNTVTNFKNVFH